MFIIVYICLLGLSKYNYQTSEIPHPLRPSRPDLPQLFQGAARGIHPSQGLAKSRYDYGEVMVRFMDLFGRFSIELPFKVIFLGY